MCTLRYKVVSKTATNVQSRQQMKHELWFNLRLFRVKWSLHGYDASVAPRGPSARRFIQAVQHPCCNVQVLSMISSYGEFLSYGGTRVPPNNPSHQTRTSYWNNHFKEPLNSVFHFQSSKGYIVGNFQCSLCPWVHGGLSLLRQVNMSETSHSSINDWIADKPEVIWPFKVVACCCCLH